MSGRTKSNSSILYPPLRLLCPIPSFLLGDSCSLGERKCKNLGIRLESQKRLITQSHSGNKGYIFINTHAIET